MVWSWAPSWPQINQRAAYAQGGKQGRVAREQELCVQAMAATYSTHAAAIGPCKCLPYLITVLDETAHSTLREHLLHLLHALVRPAALADSATCAKAEAAAAENADEAMRAGGVRLLLDLAAMAHMQTAPFAAPAGGPALLMDVAQSEVDAIASWWYYVAPPPEGSNDIPADAGARSVLCGFPAGRTALVQCCAAPAC
jgi:hypothetical protein